jgi:hypothetical protein
MEDKLDIVPVGQIEQSILMIRGQKIILDRDLAALYGVSTSRLNQQVQRNAERFPEDFMFPLSQDEARRLMLQFATSKRGRGGYRKPPCAFTEHGAIMAASVLKSPQAVKVSVYVVRAFVKLREALSNHRIVGQRLTELERKLQTHDGQIKALIEAIRQLMEPPDTPPKKRIGYASERDSNAGK